MNDEEKIKYVLEETNRLLRYIDNFYWVLSSFWMGGTGFAISKALEMKGKDWHIIGLSIIVIIAWILYILFTKHTYYVSLHYLGLANVYEEKLKIKDESQSIDILPKTPLNHRGLHFMSIMYIIASMVIIVMILFLIEYCLLN